MIEATTSEAGPRLDRDFTISLWAEVPGDRAGAAGGLASKFDPGLAHGLQSQRDLERRRLQRAGRRAAHLVRDRRRQRAALVRLRAAVADLELREQLAHRLRGLALRGDLGCARRGGSRPRLPPSRRDRLGGSRPGRARGRARRRPADRASRRALRGDLELRLDARPRPGSRSPAASTATTVPGRWEDCGQPGRSRRIFSLASYRGDLLAFGDDSTVHVHRGGAAWEQVTAFDTFAHPVTVHDGRLVLGMLQPATVRSFDGGDWRDLGNPIGDPERCDEIHTLVTFRRRAPRRHVAARPRRPLGRRRRALAAGRAARRQHRGHGAERLQRQALRRRDPARRGLPLRARRLVDEPAPPLRRRPAGGRCWCGT